MTFKKLKLTFFTDIKYMLTKFHTQSPSTTRSLKSTFTTPKQIDNHDFNNSQLYRTISLNLEIHNLIVKIYYKYKFMLKFEEYQDHPVQNSNHYYMFFFSAYLIFNT